ncbi:unnamed protein product [Discula destructiva]
MSRPVEQALLSLLPTQNSNLPPSLVELARSLLAQSRNKVSTLRAEEEIARTYACSHLACDRLKITLNLPPIEPRPPVPPRIYKRLYSLLDKELPNTALAGRPKANGRGTPGFKALSSPAPRATPSRGTPTKDLSLAQFRTPGKLGAPVKSNSHSALKQGRSALPPWIRPTVRHICSILAVEDGPGLAPTVEAGLDATIAPFRTRTPDDWVDSHLTALVGAIYWFVAESAALAPGEEMGEASQLGYKGARKAILGALRGARDAVQIPISTTRGKKAEVTEEQEAAFWEGWQDSIKAADFDETITEITSRGWLKSDWYRSIEYLRDSGEGSQEGDDLGAPTASAAAKVQTSRPDTMMQDKTDYLSERRRADYRRWEADILQRIKVLERAHRSDAMEVDG